MVKNSNIKELIEEPKEIKSLNWLDKNKFKEILTIIDTNKFGHKNKIGKFKYIDIKDLVNNIKDDTISEIDAKKRLNTLKMSSKEENKSLKEENEKLNENENENEDDDIIKILIHSYEYDEEKINQNKKIK